MEDENEYRRFFLQKLVKQLGRGGIARLARELEVDSTYVSRMLSAPTTKQARPVTAETVLKLNKLYPDWQSDRPNESNSVISDVQNSIQPGYIRLEHLSASPAMGVGATIDEPVEVVRRIDVLERWVREEIGTADAKRIKVLTAVGRSMQPTINDRDLVFVDIARRHIDAPGIYVIDVAGRLLLKKAMIQADGTLILRSDNTDEYPDEERYQLSLAAEMITVCGKVMAWWTLRKG